LSQARTAHSAELMDLHLVAHVIGLGIVLDGNVAHWLADGLLPQLLLWFLVVVRQVPSRPNILHRDRTIRSPSHCGGVLARRV